MTPEEIELYRDLIKIGIPALVGLSAGLIPYFIERKRNSAQKEIEISKIRHDTKLQLAEALSKSIGSSISYLMHLISLKSNDKQDEEWAREVVDSGKIMLENTESRVKSKALAGMLGERRVINAMIAYDRAIADAINRYNELEKVEESEKDIILDDVRKKENAMIHSLKYLD